MHDQIRSQLSLQLRGLVAQRLLPTTDGKGRVPAVEIMFNNPAIAALIRENNIQQIPLAISGGHEDGMQTFNQALYALAKADLITEEEALLKATNPEALRMNFRGIFLDESRRILASD